MQSKCRCCPPSSRRSVPAWRIKRVARFSRQQGCADRCYTRSKRNASPTKLIKPPAFEYDSTTRPPTRRYPTPPPSWQHCPRVPESLRQRFVDFPRWALTVGTSCASLPALIFLTYPEREQLLRQRAADVTVYTHAPFCASQQTPEAPESRPTQVRTKIPYAYNGVRLRAQTMGYQDKEV